MKPIYMDHHATTPLHPEALAAMMPFLTEEFGNPASTTHVYGRRASDAVEGARASLAAALGVRPAEIIFTGGATEANNLALRGVCAAARERLGSAHVVTSAVEHKSVLDTVRDLERDGIGATVLPVDSRGRVDPCSVRDALRPDTCLVSVQVANSEIGTLQPLAEIAPLCAAAGVPLHADAAQAVGRVPLQPARSGVALLSLSAHKFHGPKAIGALYCDRRVRLRAQQTGGGHERNRRSGTLSPAAIVGMAAALEVVLRDMEAEAARLAGLRDRLWEGIRTAIPDVRRNGDSGHALPNNLNVSFRHVEGEALLMAVKGFALSSGSACTSGSGEPSHVLRALGLDDESAHASIRFGLGRGNLPEHVDALVEELRASVQRLRSISGAAESSPGPGERHVAV